jgi:N-acetylmuramoyl-L-alanine amidase
MLKIDNKGWLEGDDVIKKPTPHFSKGVTNEAGFIVEHFTAGMNAEPAVAWLTDPTRTSGLSSAHLVIGQGGRIWQLAPFTAVTWHAGDGTWPKGVARVNYRSIGIEHSNAGKLTRRADGRWITWSNNVVPDNEVVLLKHKFEASEQGWHIYDPAMVERSLEVQALIIAKYPSIKQIVGRDDVAYPRKTDPGPAFPMYRFQELLHGRAHEGARGDKYLVIASTLNVRGGPGLEHATVSWSPLPKGTRVEVLQTAGEWSYVALNAQNGWVSTRYLQPV